MADVRADETIDMMGGNHAFPFGINHISVAFRSLLRRRFARCGTQQTAAEFRSDCRPAASKMGWILPVLPFLNISLSCIFLMNIRLV